MHAMVIKVVGDDENKNDDDDNNNNVTSFNTKTILTI